MVVFESINFHYQYHPVESHIILSIKEMDGYVSYPHYSLTMFDCYTLCPWHPNMVDAVSQHHTMSHYHPNIHYISIKHHRASIIDAYFLNFIPPIVDHAWQFQIKSPLKVIDCLVCLSFPIIVSLRFRMSHVPSSTQTWLAPSSFDYFPWLSDFPWSPSWLITWLAIRHSSSKNGTKMQKSQKSGYL